MSARERPADQVTASGLSALEKVLSMPEELAAAVRIFYDDEWTFAGSTFLAMKSDANRIEAEDLLAVTLMGEMFPARAVRQLLDGPERLEAERLLKLIDVGRALWKWDIDALHSDGHPVLELWRMLDGFPYVGATRASKLMARKRPNLVPIYDSVVGKHIATADDYWYVFHAFLKEETNQGKVKDIRRKAGVDKVPLLRVLDTAVWMRYSRGTAAKAVREQTGLPIEP